MGTNFYFYTKSKETADRMGPKAEVTDYPEFGYEIHIAKTSCGWLPLFEAHRDIRSVKDLRQFYIENKGRDNTLTILDEYETTYDWHEFKKRVIEFGTPKHWNAKDRCYDGNWRCETDNDCRQPWNHWEGEWKDSQGYRFQEADFC